MADQIKRAIIMRGVVGAGKSTTARFLASGGREDFDEDLEFWIRNCVTYFGKPEGWANGHYAEDDDEKILSAIHSTDQYFINKEGVYRFIPKRLWPNHNANYKAFRDSIDNKVPLVIADNTNTQHKEFKRYVDYAQNAGYWVSFHVMPHPKIDVAVERNTHNVPREAILRMLKRWEP